MLSLLYCGSSSLPWTPVIEIQVVLVILGSTFATDALQGFEGGGDAAENLHKRSRVLAICALAQLHEIKLIRFCHLVRWRSDSESLDEILDYNDRRKQWAIFADSTLRKYEH